MNDTYKKGKDIVKYFLNRAHAYAIFRTQSNLDLLKLGKTRFASHHSLLKRLAHALATTVVLGAWKDWVKSGDENARAMGAKVTEAIADDTFWDEVDILLSITKPNFLMIKFADGEGPKMEDIYEKMDCMIGEIKDIMQDNKYTSDYPKMEEIMVAGWEKMNIPLHCLGCALNPHFFDISYLQSPAPGGILWCPPNMDKEVVKGVLEVFDKIGENESERKLLRKQIHCLQIWTNSLHQIDPATAVCGKESYLSLMVSILAFHKALADQPRDPLVIATFCLAVHSGGSLSEAVRIAKSISQPHDSSFPEVLEPNNLFTDENVMDEVKDLAASVRAALSKMTDGASVSQAMAKYPQAPHSDLVFISMALQVRTDEIISCVTKGREKAFVPKRSSNINYESLAVGNLHEVRFMLSRVIFDTIYPPHLRYTNTRPANSEKIG
ncbi:LOW QUALITY PROTEIN: hypothetical protein Cgig2_028543 [Carnegiea gigantea]|uniref:Uncharacterized protein n=1 Tax=Carnegiea gigantea TaxID=171969 RepID=A0A9Q1JVX3_9CARY|nr:LOW QUALITY PROTEIN: hypothetical protein Cgig2_028543 [Carnegiea gigantea]